MLLLLYSFFLIWNFTVFLFLNFSLYILWINKFSSWQCLTFCLISIQERANIQKLLCYKINFKDENILKYLLFKRQVRWSFCYSLASLAIVTPSIRKCNFASNCTSIFGELFHIYKFILSKNQVYWNPYFY